jgi:hypothetical protein
MSENKIFNVEWEEKYSKLGVTPQELYMRQNGLCYLRAEKEDGEVVIYCTDGQDKERTDCLLNPTFECSKCISSFAKRVIENGIKSSES